jgi:hypothetical protein
MSTMKQTPIWPRLPNAQECAILLLHLIELRGGDLQPLNRVRLSELTLKRLWSRNRLSSEFLEEVQEWLSRGGWSLFFAQNTFAAIKTSAVKNWVRVSSKLITDDLDLVERGEFDFQKYLHLITNKTGDASDD